jgi:hypothetical protein
MEGGDVIWGEWGGDDWGHGDDVECPSGALNDSWI